MKRIDLGSGYVIDIDSLNMTLKKDVKIAIAKESQKEYETCNVIGYYGSLESVFKGLYREKVIDALEDKQSIESALKVFIGVRKELNELFKKIEIK